MSESPESTSSQVDGSEAAVGTRRRARGPRKLPFDSIRDDARRSISVRVNTSDYGRLKSAARRLGVRESDVFRHLLRSGLERLLRVLDMAVDSTARYRLLVDAVAEFGEDFGMTVLDCIAVLDARGTLALDAADIELLSLAASYPIQAGLLLDQLAGTACTAGHLPDRLAAHLVAKHAAKHTES